MFLSSYGTSEKSPCVQDGAFQCLFRLTNERGAIFGDAHLAAKTVTLAQLIRGKTCSLYSGRPCCYQLLELFALSFPNSCRLEGIDTLRL